MPVYRVEMYWTVDGSHEDSEVESVSFRVHATSVEAAINEVRKIRGFEDPRIWSVQQVISEALAQKR